MLRFFRRKTWDSLHVTVRHAHGMRRTRIMRHRKHEFNVWPIHNSKSGEPHGAVKVSIRFLGPGEIQVLTDGALGPDDG